MRRKAALAAGALLLIQCALAFPAQAAPPQTPALEAVLSPDSLTADASYNDQDVVFSDVISLSGTPYAKYEVFLESSASQPWAAICSPGYLTFWGDGSAPFNVTVRVPRLAAGQTARVWVESRATYEDTDFAGNISGSVHVTVGKLPQIPEGNGTGYPVFGTDFGKGSPVACTVLSLALVAVIAVLSVATCKLRGTRMGKPPGRSD